MRSTKLPNLSFNMIPTHSSPSVNRAARPKARRKPYVVIHGYHTLKDGGTAILHTNRGKFYIDGRITTKTKGKIFDDYPANKGAAQITDERIIRSINAQYEV